MKKIFSLSVLFITFVVTFNCLITLISSKKLIHKNPNEGGCLTMLKNFQKKMNEKKETGHFEKFIKTVTEYVYVPGERPSGVPNAFVVSENEALSNNPFLK
jgi:hypothetical protein